MNNEALNYAHGLLKNNGYKGTVDDFTNLLSTDPNAAGEVYSLFQNEGYKGSANDFVNLFNQPEQQEETENKNTDILQAEKNIVKFGAGLGPLGLATSLTTGVTSMLVKALKDPEQRDRTKQYMRNSIDNMPETLKSWVKSSQQLYVDTYKRGYLDEDSMFSKIYGKEKVKDLSKISEAADDFILKKYEEIGELEFKDTGKGIVAGVKEGDPASVIAGVFNAGKSTVETIIPAAATGGLALFPMIAAPMYTDYNKSKAKALYGGGKDKLTAEEEQLALEKLVENKEAEIAMPIVLGSIATGLEFIGFKGISKYISAFPGKGRGILNLMWTGVKEGNTEIGQLGAETLNNSLGEQKSIEQASIDAYNDMFSDKGLEAWFNGFLGSTQVSVGGRALNRALRNDNASLKDVNQKINNIADLNNVKFNTRDKDIRDAVDVEIKEAEQDLKNYVNEKRKLNEVLTEEEKTSLINILNEKDGVKEKAENLRAKLENEDITNKEFGYAIRSLNNQDKRLSDQITGIQSAATGRAAQQVTETVKEQIKEAGLEGEVTEMTSEEISNIKEEGFNSKEAARQFGFIRQNTDGSFEITLNKDKPMVGTAAHEFMHAVLFKTLGNQQQLQDNLGDALVDHVSELGGETSVLGERLKAYGKFNKDGVFERDANFGEETITIMSEEIINGNLKFNENFFTKIGDIVRRFSQNYLGKEITFDTGRDVYNFVKDYTKSIKDGKINKAILKVAKEGAKGKLVKDKAKPEATVQMSKDASDNVQRIYEQQGEAGAMDIIDAFKPITSKLVERRSQAPNFDRQLLTDEIETGQRGIFDLIREYKPDSGVPLAAYINKFLPARAIEASKRVLGEEFTEDVTEAKTVAAEEVTTETKARPKPKKIVLAERFGITDKVSKAINKIVPDLDINKLTFKTLKNKIPNVTGELFGITPKKIESLANLTKKELQAAQMFINKNADLLINMLPEGATTSGTATGVPNTLLKAFYTKTDRAKMAKTGTKAGLAIQQKNNIKKTDFLETFGIIDGKPDRTDRNTSARVLALANLTGKMITNQAVRAELAKLKVNDKAINKIAEGKSNTMFSRDAKEFNINGTIDSLLGIHADKVGRKTFKLRTQQDIDLYIEALINDVLPLMPREFWFGTPDKEGVFGSEFTPSNRVVDNKDIYRDYQSQILALNQLPDSSFGKPIDGVNDFSRPNYKSLFEGKKGVQVDKINEVNKRSGKIHEALWSRIFESIQKNPSSAAAIGNYFKIVSKKVNHWHRFGAEIVGYSTSPKGDGKKLYEYEHAMPATASYLYLIDAALKGYNFKSTYKPVMDNFKLIALDAADNKKLTIAGLATKMPEGWNTIDNKWWERYFNDKVDIDPESIVALDNKTFKDKFNIVQLKPDLKNNIKFSKVINKSRTPSEPKGITVLDFDDTLATTKSLVKYTTPDGETGTLNAEEFASTYEDLQDQGFTFDFSDFNKVVKGKIAPLFQKAIKLQGKFGPENMFVLTARPPASQKAIFDFLKANGLNIPLKNITGLGNSTSEAKALWIADKVSEGYNDFYFADDALQNVQAVKNMLDQFDVKSKVQQAKVKFSKDMNTDFNNILEDVTGIESKKRFSDIKARKRGASKGKFRFFIPPSHEDFTGLLYNFMGKGRKGDQHRDFFEQALVRPLNRAYREIDTAKQAIANDYKELNKQFKDVKKKLTKKTPDGDFMFEDAIRVYLWNKHGYDIPGLSPTDQQNLVDLVMQDPDLRAYAETLNIISKQDTYVDPGQGWEGGGIKTDLIDATGRVGRAEYFAEFNENADILFSSENLNKIEAAYGKDFRSALEDMLHRISTGINRPKGQSGTINKFMNYLNGSVGTVMFFNVRSAILQQMSIVNYINFADNNVFAAAKAFANQPQYWKDFAFIFNSDMLKQRRGGIGTDINGADLAQAVKGSKDPTKVVISRLLQLGFLPTQIGDNIAIATGGATFYRNRVNKYIKDGLNEKEAETKAFTDFQDLTQSTQQSSRPDMTSKQQSSWIGKLVLNFQNITSQYNRIIKKAALDIAKGRISPPYTTKAQSNLGNLSKILYYGAIQNVIFYSLQTALFAVMFGDDEDEDQILKKSERVIQGSIDSILRGAGIYGAIISTLKNTLRKFKEQRDKGYNKDESAVLMELLNFSPVVGIKARQIVNAEKTINYNENVINEMETFDADNPQWSAVTNYTQALTNFPANRLYQKSINMRNALDKDYTNFQRVMFFSGYTTWSLGLGDTEAVVEAKEKVKINKANARKEKRVQKQIEKIEANKSIIEENKKKKDGRCANVNASGNRCQNKAIKDGMCTIHEKTEKISGGRKVQCRKRKADGSRCKMQTANKSQYCYYHD